MTKTQVAPHTIPVPTVSCPARTREALQVRMVAALLAVVSMPAVARGGSDDISSAQSGDRLLAHIVAQYGRAELDRGGWTSPYVPSAAGGNPIAAVPVGEGVTLLASEHEMRDGASGNEIVMRAVAQYTRAALDRGGWENPFVPDGRCAAGDALLAVQPGEGVTMNAAEAETTTISHRERNTR